MQLSKIGRRSQSNALGWPQWQMFRAELLILICIVPLTIALSFVRLGHYPTISGWDEGMYLLFAHNLAHHGEYATRNGDTFEQLSPSGGTGPTLVMPVALALATSDNQLAAARVITASYLLLALAGAYLVVRHLAGWPAAIAGLTLFLTAGYPAYDTLWMGRQVLAEVPAMAFLLMGIWAWFKSWHTSWRWTIVSGFLIGAAVVTKNQFLWVVGPAFALIALCDYCYYRQLGWRHRLAPIIGIVLGYGSWGLLSLWIIGPEGRTTYLETQRALTSALFWHFYPQRWLSNLAFLRDSGQWIVMFLALGYLLYQARQRSAVGLKQLTLLATTSLMLTSFVLISLPWARLLYPVLALSAICVAVSLGGMLTTLKTRRQLTAPFSALLLLIFVTALAGPRLVQSTQRILTTDDPSAVRFAGLVDEYVPEDAFIGNWEWEVEFYSERTFVHPPYRLFAAQVDAVYNQRFSPMLDQPAIPDTAEYLIIGPVADQTLTFIDELEQRPHHLLAREGPYRLYQLDP
ncbi:MAG: hypothetical protein AAGF95_10135 [Chloroflexota bacterium]